MKAIILVIILMFGAAWINDPRSIEGWTKAAQEGSKIATKVVKETGSIAANSINQ